MRHYTMVIFGAICAALGAGFGASVAAAQDLDSVVKKMRATGTITMGYRETLMPVSYLDDDKKPAGYSVEMCLRIIEEARKELKLPELKVNYVPVNIQTRQALVANGTVDLECGGTVNTFARNRQVDFSPVTYVAASQLLILKSSGISKYEDLDGKVVVVATAGSSEPELKHIIAEKKLKTRVLNVDDHAAALIAVESRRADAYFSDNGAFFSLIKQSKNPDSLTVVGEPYGYSPQGFMVPKNNPAFLWIVNHAMAQMFKSGEAEKLFDKWFGPFGVKVSPKLRAAWETVSYAE
jgi:glutamate/aspartate transport system substrate-binding protein